MTMPQLLNQRIDQLAEVISLAIDPRNPSSQLAADIVVYLSPSGYKNFSKIAIINDLLVMSVAAVKSGAAYSSSPALSDLVDFAHSVYGSGLTRYSGTRSNQFWNQYLEDRQPFGAEHFGTQTLAADLAVTAEKEWGGLKAIDAYFDMRGRVLAALTQGADQANPTVKTFLGRESRIREKLSVRTPKSKKRPSSGSLAKPAEARTSALVSDSSVTLNISTATHSLNDAITELESLIGLPSVKAEVATLSAVLNIQKMRRMAGLPPAKQSLHFVFYGNPGTGKTTVARILGDIFRGYGVLQRGHVVETSRSDLVGGFIGQTAMKTDERIQEAIDGILFVDEAYMLASESSIDFGAEAINTLLKRMEDLRDRLVVIVAGYPAQMQNFIQMNPGLESRFTRYLAFEDFNPDELLQIFYRFASTDGYEVNQAADELIASILAEKFKKRTERFGNARDVRNFYEIVLGRQAVRLSAVARKLTTSELQTITAADIPQFPIHRPTQKDPAN